MDAKDFVGKAVLKHFEGENMFETRDHAPAPTVDAWLRH
jgi:hypothetical protein